MGDGGVDGKLQSMYLIPCIKNVIYFNLIYNNIISVHVIYLTKPQ